MSEHKSILIAGAGPSGLAAAIFLHDLGYKPRIIDKKTEISPYSKALAVNPRSLDLLEKSGITKCFLSNGRKMLGMNMWKGDRHIFRNDFSKSNHRYPFLLMQTQKESEEILLDEVLKRGMTVDYRTEMHSFEKRDGKYVSKITSELPTPNSELISDYIIGADGGHSVLRKQLGTPFDGMRYRESWELYDVELETELFPDDAHIRVFKDGGMIMIRIKENMWRVAGNLKDLLNYLPPKTKAGKVTWKTDFYVSHHVAGALVKDNIVLIGDAAHLHSPIGGRGMNLGMEDAYITTKLIHENRLGEYNNMRRPYLLKTVNRIHNASQMVAARSGIRRFMKNNLVLFKPFFPIVKPVLRNFALGLDGKSPL